MTEPDPDLAAVRRNYADVVRAAGNLRHESLVHALARVPRERFVGAGPWKTTLRAPTAGSTAIAIESLGEVLSDDVDLDPKPGESEVGVLSREVSVVVHVEPARRRPYVLAADRSGARIPAIVLERLGRQLAPCLGQGWVDRIPEEDPFG